MFGNNQKKFLIAKCVNAIGSKIKNKDLAIR